MQKTFNQEGREGLRRMFGYTLFTYALEDSTVFSYAEHVDSNVFLKILPIFVKDFVAKIWLNLLAESLYISGVFSL